VNSKPSIASIRAASGLPLNGQAVNPNKFQGVSTLNQLEVYGLKRPHSAEKASAKDTEFAAAKALREHVNRSFDAARLRRAELYSAYIQNVECNGHLGGTPAITLFFEGSLTETENGVLIPYRATLAAIDGETQTEARYMLRDREATTGDNPVAITLYHGISEEAAMQILHDYNANANPIRESKLAQFNREGRLTVAIAAVTRTLGIERHLINTSGAGGTKKKIVGQGQMLSFLAGFQANGLALTRSMKAAHFAEFNTVKGTDVPAAGISGLGALLKLATTDVAFRSISPEIWQVAGAVCAAGASMERMNWAAGNAARRAALVAKAKAPERLAAIATALQA